jgi:hypothetical protein
VSATPTAAALAPRGTSHERLMSVLRIQSPAARPGLPIPDAQASNDGKVKRRPVGLSQSDQASLGRTRAGLADRSFQATRRTVATAFEPRHSSWPRRREDLVGPAVIEMLNSAVGLVGPAVAMSCCESVSQRLELLEPVAPLKLTLTCHGCPPATARRVSGSDRGLRGRIVRYRHLRMILRIRNLADVRGRTSGHALQALPSLSAETKSRACRRAASRATCCAARSRHGRCRACRGPASVDLGRVGQRTETIRSGRSTSCRSSRRPNRRRRRRQPCRRHCMGGCLNGPDDGHERGRVPVRG